MHKTKSLKALKKAKQERSRQTYQAILDATAHILANNPNRLNTNTIAEIAGVSIGSLYQYFPNKQAIIAELIEREFKIDITTIKNMALKYNGDSVQTIIDNYLITASLISQREFSLKQVLNIKLAETEKVQQASKLQIEFIDILTTLFSSAINWPVDKDARLFSYICFTVTANTYWMGAQLGEYTHNEIKKELFNLFSYYINT